ncbi:nicotinate-nucleotide adenylyltransferase [uncultured Bartonella sp.]|uniref:nicotinate-nucleotide adenylyltransferase n=1 Tax=uncultured Bartonella sp. TaxID=104108 RepID=UPI0026173B81|nr:nicotinate-nucleotide adenylyltransferase [uncultured Bartonella sp.]
MKDLFLFKNRLPSCGRGNCIGLFGGSFNPPHEGHLLVAKIALQRLKLDQLWWMVTPGNPLKDQKDLLSVDERICLSEKLAEDPRIKITGFEQKIRSYKTVSTIEYILAHHKDVHFVWVMGADSLKSFHHWHKWREIVAMIPIAIIDRPDARMSALFSPMAETFSRFRVKDYDIAALPYKKPPAWGYIHGKRSYASSTKLRQKTL